jgi:hypothetical protein
MRTVPSDINEEHHGNVSKCKIMRPHTHGVGELVEAGRLPLEESGALGGLQALVVAVEVGRDHLGGNVDVSLIVLCAYACNRYWSVWLCMEVGVCMSM